MHVFFYLGMKKGNYNNNTNTSKVQIIGLENNISLILHQVGMYYLQKKTSEFIIGTK